MSEDTFSQNEIVIISQSHRCFLREKTKKQMLLAFAKRTTMQDMLLNRSCVNILPALSAPKGTRLFQILPAFLFCLGSCHSCFDFFRYFVIFCLRSMLACYLFMMPPNRQPAALDLLILVFVSKFTKTALIEIQWCALEHERNTLACVSSSTFLSVWINLQT